MEAPCLRYCCAWPLHLAALHLNVGADMVSIQTQSAAMQAGANNDKPHQTGVLLAKMQCCVNTHAVNLYAALCTACNAPTLLIHAGMLSPGVVKQPYSHPTTTH